MSKRLTVFLPALYSGGAERTMLNLANGMAERDIQVDLVLSQAEGPYLCQISPKVNLVDLSKGQVVQASRTLSRLPALVRYLRQTQPDAMLSALSRANLVAVVARALARTPRRLVVNIQNTVSQDAPNSPARLGRLAPTLSKYIYRKADAVIGVSQGVVDDLVQGVGVPAKLAKVIYNPVITPELRQKAKQPLEHPWFKAGEPPVILAVGRLMMQKDYPTLFQAFAQLRQTQPARLLILGEGPERAQLESLTHQLGIADHVSMPGFVQNPYPYIVNASTFVLSSRWEGLPTVLIEALYCGVPIVSTDCPSGPREILHNGKIGRLVPVGDAPKLAEALGAALRGEVARPTSDSWLPYDVDQVLNSYSELLFN
ncbi:MAG: glycosyltransferase [Caldilineaceae bacterium]